VFVRLRRTEKIFGVVQKMRFAHFLHHTKYLCKRRRRDTLLEPQRQQEILIAKL
jgi:hypothetical protein